ncbi:hypothetical protein LUZ60_015888 [Juncus effusus]|nr:hypothetical protein LUZ60_015888 [Juncus effusus]
MSPTTYTVTFGRSTPLGRSLLSFLLSSSPHSLIRSLDPPITSPELSPPSDRISFHQTDFSNRANLIKILSESSVLFHVDPTSAVESGGGGGGGFQAVHSLAVGSTKALIEACKEAGVGRIVYTGSADVVVDARGGGVCDGDESIGYPDKYIDAVSELRAQVEIMILNANGKNGLQTCVLRPSNMFGPGDSNLIPFFGNFSRSLFGKFIIGNGKNMCDFTYVDNVAHANICADKALSSDPNSVAGKTFFITNGEPVETWEFISRILEGLGYQRPYIHIPAKFLSLVAHGTEMAREKLGFGTVSNHFLSPPVINFLSCTRTFNCSRARNILGYSPVIRLEDGIARTVGSFSEFSSFLISSKSQDFGQISKAEKLLGGGSVSDILLWRDDKRTFAYVILSYLLFYWFLLSGHTFISSAAKILLVISVALFAHGFLPSTMFGFTIEKVSSDSFEISESSIKGLFYFIASKWNKGLRTILILSDGHDSLLFFKVVASLYLLKLLFSLSLAVLSGLGLVCLFSVFIIYDQCEEEIDKLIARSSIEIQKLIELIIAKLPSPLLDFLSKYL